MKLSTSFLVTLVALLCCFYLVKGNGDETNIDCSTVRCAQVICPDNHETYVKPGQCCNSCRNCSETFCTLAIKHCPDGQFWGRPQGKCCPDCIPCNQKKFNSCSRIAIVCPVGQTPGRKTNECCTSCVECPKQECPLMKCKEGYEMGHVTNKCCPTCVKKN
ncbi:hypothetical protein DFA_04281 [Cavenderia fasciculata]|uniref:TNFR-Cys domain-containing protein n=1 Tax=Cavenderia fasciculata TaxID=261658 RepID=F4PP50_CACFS|nr:uncharacterized protein DFA_04281 [Cavenderia fasciculata]EGG22163.1 hypothetical protein DFA_04281 [Cavenderia fasciculata]|eukprot:XP_004360014.1 hypothetical protein DFA_04281 [Cavenderia fasciculata]